MSTDKVVDASLEQFKARKHKHSMSNAELSRRTGLSVNTIKAFIDGKPVREATAQSLQEALDDYIAERTQKKTMAVPQGESAPDGLDAGDLEIAALRKLVEVRALLEKSREMRIDAEQEPSSITMEKLRFQISLVQPLLV